MDSLGDQETSQSTSGWKPYTALSHTQVLAQVEVALEVPVEALEALVEVLEEPVLE